MATREQVERVLIRPVIAPVLPFDLSAGEPVVFDFSAANRELEHLPLNDVAELTEYLFELIIDGDFPGVAAPSQRARWLELCPDPNLMLGNGPHTAR